MTAAIAAKMVEPSMLESKPDGESSRKSSARPCPICGKPAVAETRPFCSKRCADVDLHRWLGSVYAIPAVESEEEPEPPASRDDD